MARASLIVRGIFGCVVHTAYSYSVKPNVPPLWVASENSPSTANAWERRRSSLIFFAVGNLEADLVVAGVDVEPHPPRVPRPRADPLLRPPRCVTPPRADPPREADLVNAGVRAESRSTTRRAASTHRATVRRSTSRGRTSERYTKWRRWTS